MGDRPEFDVLDGAFWAGDPHPALAWMRRHDPVWRDEASGVWAISRHADVREASRRPEVFTSTHGIRPEIDDRSQRSMVELDPPEHTPRRRIFSRGFTPRSIGSLEASIIELSDQLLDEVCELGSCDIVRDVASLLPLHVIGELMGFPVPDREQLLDWSDALMHGVAVDAPAEVQQAAMEAAVGFAGYLAAALPVRRAEPGDDLVSKLVVADVEGGQLDEGEIIANSLLLLIGGDETTRHVISGGLFELLRTEGAWELLAADPSKVPTAVEEMLRWVSPVKLEARFVTEDVVLGETHVPAGVKVALLYPSANRDEDVFADPDRFDVERTPNEHLAFGHGPHHCLGASLARLELRVLLERLLVRMPDLALVGPERPPSRPSSHVSGLESLAVRFTPQRPVARSTVAPSEAGRQSLSRTTQMWSST